ncbi:hypothetical protein BKA62DRAFT_617953, partial [Auriculariales sp. MPI-PUGE-AT-0066]
GSVVAELLLQKGFRVRGVGRSATKAAQLIEHFKTKYGADSFEFAEVADFSVSAAFDTALQDVAGVVHVATETNLAVLDETETALIAASAAVLGLMKASAAAGTVRSFVLTSSVVSMLGGAIQYGTDGEFSTEDWQDHLIPLAKSLPPGDVKRVVSYGATKVHAEREAFKFWNETKPGYAFNVVLPALILGPVANPTKGIVYSTHTWLNDLFIGNRESTIMQFLNPAVTMVDTRDSASIHVAALLSTELNGERLLASAHAFTANQILAVWRTAFPDRIITADFNFPVHPKIVFTDIDKSTKLLKEFANKDWYSFEESVIANAETAL